MTDPEQPPTPHGKLIVFVGTDARCREFIRAHRYDPRYSCLEWHNGCVLAWIDREAV